MKIKHGEIRAFSEFLLELKLKGKQSRMRTRLLKVLESVYNRFLEEHKQLLIEHSKKDEEGNPITKTEDDQVLYQIEDEKAFEKDFNELLFEEYIVEQNEANREMLETVRDAVLNCEEEFSGLDALAYDRWCEIVEQIDYDKK